MLIRVINLCCVALLSASPILAINLGVAHSEDKEELSRKERLIHWLHNRHSPKHLGLDDPHLPSFVKFRPLLIRSQRTMSSQKFFNKRKFFGYAFPHTPSFGAIITFRFKKIF